MKDKDIFDRLMSLRPFRFAYPLYEKYKEPLLYIFFGVLTTVINFIVFALFTYLIPLNELIANVIAWVFAVLFAYVTNRIWVFSNKAHTTAGFVREILAFYSGRIVTLLLEEAVLLIFVTWLAQNAFIVKLCAQVMVIVLNYVISKWLVFRKSKQRNNSPG